MVADTPPIWRQAPDLDALNALHESTAVSHMGIVLTAVGPNWLRGTIPVDERTKQPFGLMHGGSAALLLETLASTAANCCVDLERAICVGLELNCNHLRGVRDGIVTGTATAIHVGRSTLVWQLEAHDEMHRLVTVGRLTSSVVTIEHRRG